ncbi:Gfo/Idh/MocA family protein [Zongyangia hominis]|uniref:Gfo/Idh/MocA family oxidoreductase n=1 Tax=Zongyangia hominis TaxID=2763677 RepID=A0A926ECV2_9FIRM|nr:Gfo/Idh/MocA family oxidoreductase [Zongyangia hominis]MBC8570730.1 Gfo/Idh/MocA family oxidoreductase [Zongyangia hominis]
MSTDKKIKWGIMGTGWIADKFCTALHACEDAEVYAVGSRTQESADKFAKQYGIPKAYPTYEALVSDPEVDVVYIATPHRLHYENALLCLNHGKAVLNEKAFTVNAKQAREIQELAKEKDLFVMEAFWPRFQPVNRELYRLIKEENLIGDIKMMKVDFVKVEDWPDEHRIYNINLAGGTMLDLGIYVLSYTARFLGPDPCEFHSVGSIGHTGVDDQTAIVMKYPDNAIAVLAAALRTKGCDDAYIYGSKGYVHVPHFWGATEATIYPEGGEPIHLDMPFIENGYEYEAMEVMQCLRDGKKQSEIMPLDETVKLMEIMDACRASWNFKYPFED